MKESAEWRALAERIDASDYLSTPFLCIAIDGEDEGCTRIEPPPLRMRARMIDRLKRDREGWGYASAVPLAWYSNTIGYDMKQTRILACLWLAEEAEDEGE